MTVVTLEEQKVLWERAKAQGLPTCWDNKARVVQAGYPPDDVQKYCVRNNFWQKLRLDMKGKPTAKKLQMLEAWWKSLHDSDNFTHESQRSKEKYIVECQVGNYLGALRRGGQLDDQNRIRKWL